MLRLYSLLRLFLFLILRQCFVDTHPLQNSNIMILPSPRLLDGPEGYRLIKSKQSLQHRAPDDFMASLGFGWGQTFQEFSSWLPARTASNTLESFYKGMLYNAQHVWPLASPARTLLVKQGALTLRLFCDKRNIPWTMVEDIAKVFIKATELGFTGRYEGRFVYFGTAATVTTIYVSLRINQLQTV